MVNKAFPNLPALRESLASSRRMGENPLAAIGKTFGEMPALHPLRALKIGQCARQFQNAVIAAR